MGKCLSDQFQLFITCEHGGNNVPENFTSLFTHHQELLNSHRGWDPGALNLAKKISQTLHSPFFFSTTTRLLVELNRSIGNKRLFSEVTKKLPNAYKRDIIQTFYLPYRVEVENFIKKNIQEGKQVLHLSIHSFTPKLEGEERKADVGFLYDPQRSGERCFCSLWYKNLRSQNPSYTVRKNYPYAGKSDGFATYLRKQYAEELYVGIELEINQKFYLGDNNHSVTIDEDILVSLKNTIDTL